MSEMKAVVKEICQKYGNDRARLMEIVRGVQEELGYVPPEAFELIAEEANTHRVEVESVVSF